jgi:hypothetical protein
MFDIDVQFIDASEWQSQPWYSSGGTRAKKILQAPDGSEYYFKCSEKKEAKEGKPAKEYIYEFWNEIIAYQLGKNLGLDVLRYDIAIHNNEIGCLSPKMNKTGDEQLIEVGRFMTAINENFLPEDNHTRKEYTFQLLEKVIDEFNLSEYWEYFFETLLFDAIIGNTDRHQENWAFLGKTSAFGEHIDLLHTELKEIKKGLPKIKDLPIPWFIKKIIGLFIDLEKEDLKPTVKQAQLIFTNIKSFAPIYDNGSSLVRELTKERVETLLNNQAALEKYIQNGAAELHWNKQKLNHFELIGNIAKSSYIEVLRKSAKFLSKWDDQLMELILNELDSNLPEKWHDYCIPKDRKKLIVKIVSLRSKKLIDLLR